MARECRDEQISVVVRPAPPTLVGPQVRRIRPHRAFVFHPAERAREGGEIVEPKAEAALKEHLAHIQREPASTEEVAIACSYVIGSQAMDRRTNARQAWYLAAGELAGVGHDFFDAYAASVRKVTAADVQRVARKYLGAVRTVIVQPP